MTPIHLAAYHSKSSYTDKNASTRDFEFDTIYVNGSNNLHNLKLVDENWKVRLIEEEFTKRMWEVEG